MPWGLLSQALPAAPAHICHAGSVPPPQSGPISAVPGSPQRAAGDQPGDAAGDFAADISGDSAEDSDKRLEDMAKQQIGIYHGLLPAGKHSTCKVNAGCPVNCPCLLNAPKPVLLAACQQLTAAAAAAAACTWTGSSSILPDLPAAQQAGQV